MKKILIKFILIISFLYTIQAKYVEQKVRLYKIRNINKLYYISKFAMSIGKGTFQIRAKFENEVTGPQNVKNFIQIDFGIYQDDVWSKVYDENDCQLLKQSARERRIIQIPTNGEFSTYIKGELQQRRREHVWYFSLNDCDNNLTPINNNRIFLELTVLNSDGTHFSFEDGNYTTFYFLVTLITFLLTFYSIKHLQFLSKQNDELNVAFLILIVAQASWALSYFFYFVYWLDYGYRGSSYAFFDILGLLLSNFSQFVIIILIILLSWGWTINYIQIEDFDLITPLAIILGMMQLMIAGLSKINDDEHYKYHTYDGWVGIAIIIIRFLLCLYFFYCLNDSIKKSKDKIKFFLMKIGVFGTIYFLMFPFLIFMCFIAPPYVQQKIINLGIIGIHQSALLMLSFVFISRNTDYYLIARQGAKNILPNSRYVL